MTAILAATGVLVGAGYLSGAPRQNPSVPAGVGRFVKDANQIGQIHIATFDEAAETLTGIQDGFVEGAVVQHPFEFGDPALKRMAHALKGDRAFSPANNQIMVPTKVVNRDNVVEFPPELKKVKGKT